MDILGKCTFPVCRAYVRARGCMNRVQWLGRNMDNTSRTVADTADLVVRLTS